MAAMSLASKGSAPTDLSRATDASESAATSGGATGSGSGYYRLRHILVNELLEDGTLGLLLHGTSVVGFCSQRAEETGWCVGDQIVEVNGNRVTMFDEFLDRFMAAQEKGFPIDFSVLRREQCGDEKSLPQDSAEGALEDFFGATSLVDLAGQLNRKFGGPSNSAADADQDVGRLRREDSSLGYFEGAGGPDAIIENPYIQALRKRRTELLRNAEGWATDVADTLASRLATQRSDGLATLMSRVESKDVSTAERCNSRGGPPTIAGLPAEWFSCVPGKCASQSACHGDILPTPRVDRLDMEGLGGAWDQVPWQAQHRCRPGSFDYAGPCGGEDWTLQEEVRFGRGGSQFSARRAPADSTAFIAVTPDAKIGGNSEDGVNGATPLAPSSIRSEDTGNFAQHLLASR